jgi:hypothetical protein
MNNSSHTFESVWATLNRVAEQQAMSDRLRQENERVLNEKFAETEQFIDKVSKQIEKTDRQIAKTEKMVGGISMNNGLFAEEYFYNSLRKGEKILLGEKFDKLIKSEIMVNENNKTKGELDIMSINGKTLVIVEVKFRVRDKHVEKVMKKVKPFRERFPEYKNHKVYLGLASMVFDEAIEDKCKENGIAVIKQEGDSVVIHDENLKAF